MKWSTETPTPRPEELESKPVPARFYWFKGTLGAQEFVQPTIVELHYNGSTFYAKTIGHTMWPVVDDQQGQWAGPLQFPED